MLEAFEASRGSPIQYGGSSSTAVENWSGTFEWDSRADDVRLNVFGIPVYRANQREVIALPFFFFFFLSFACGIEILAIVCIMGF